MGRIIQIVRTRSASADATFDADRANIIPLPSEALRGHLAGACADCETLRKNIHTVREGLGTLESVVADIDDTPARERLQGRMVLLDQMLSLRLDQLAEVDRLLQEALQTVRS